MKSQTTFIDFILKEWLVVASGVGLVLTALYVKKIPSYSANELQILLLIFILFIVVNGLRNSGLIVAIAQEIEKGGFIPLKLVVTTFFLSMLITNDVALIVIVPLTLSLNINRKGVLVILEALAANSGSALTPIGNPQNLFVYWSYGIQPDIFVKEIVPLSLVFLGVLVLSSLFVNIQNVFQETKVQKVNKTAYLYAVLLIAVILTVFHVLPLYFGIVIAFVAVIVDRKVIRVDYSLLFSFLFFFGLADNLKIILAPEINHPNHIFILSALASQFMSNVPATLLFAKFTSNWQALLWGVNVGGFGSLFGSLANLIAYKGYVRHEDINSTTKFTVTFLIMGYAAFFLSIGLYYILH